MSIQLTHPDLNGILITMIAQIFKRFPKLFLWLLVLGYGLGGLLNSGYSQEKSAVYVVPIKGVIDLGLSAFVKRVTREAKEEHASAVIVEIDTFGGRVDAAGEIVKSLEELKPIPVKAFVLGEAWSAGALISLACEEIYMTPGSSIGSAEPRAIGMGNEEEVKDEKTISALRAKFKATAEANKHSPKLAEAFVDKDLELKLVRIGEENFILYPEEVAEKKSELGEEKIKIIKTVTEKGKLLNLTAEEAKELGMVKKIISQREELLAFLNLKEKEMFEPKPSWSENLVRFLTHPIVSSLLLTLGFLGIIFEIKIPGWGIAGTLGVISLALFFWGHYLVGLANWTEIIFFILALILIFLEIFVFPGFGFAGISGGILLLVSIFLALIKHPLHTPHRELLQAFQVVVYSFFATLVVLLLSINFLPRTGLWKRIILQEKESKEEGYSTIDLTKENLIGKIGKTITYLRPSGKAEFSGKVLDVISEGEFIEKDKEVKVISIEGAKVVVKSI
ncbi:MAG: nodulation protein NfeD [Candidatus Omnitrophica bacterium]|nr:nodulation protein NfeD [Candidatus Omnitrophota bacterium]